jgi:hypothetical protein
VLSLTASGARITQTSKSTNVPCHVSAGLALALLYQPQSLAWGKGTFHYPAKRTLINQWTPNLFDYLVHTTNHAKFGLDRMRGVVWALGWNITLGFSAFFSPSVPLTTSKYGPIFVVVTLNDVLPCVYVQRIIEIFANPVIGSHLPQNPEFSQNRDGLQSEFWNWRVDQMDWLRVVGNGSHDVPP